MSVDARHYVMIGLDVLKKIEDNYDFHMELYNKAEAIGLKYVYDEMDGKYAIVGLVVNEGDMYEGMKLTSNQKGGLNILFERSEEKIRELLGRLIRAVKVI